jgi:hypothetical protein
VDDTFCGYGDGEMEVLIRAIWWRLRTARNLLSAVKNSVFTDGTNHYLSLSMHYMAVIAIGIGKVYETGVKYADTSGTDEGA